MTQLRLNENPPQENPAKLSISAYGIQLAIVWGAYLWAMSKIGGGSGYADLGLLLGALYLSRRWDD